MTTLLAASARLTSALLIPALLLGHAPLARAAAPQADVPEAGEAAPEAGEAAPEAGEAAPADDTQDPALDEAQALFNLGADKFETADYAGAIEDWTEAYGLVPNLPEYGAIKGKLIANIAAAHDKAYAVDGEASHLNQAKILLDAYREGIPDIYPSAAEADKELSWANDRIAKIEAELEAIAKAKAEAIAEAEARRNAALEPERKPPGRALIITGSTLTALGVGGLGLMIGGLALGGLNEDIADLPTNELDARAERYATGRLGNTLAYVGGISGGALLVTGVALLAVGLEQRKAGQSSKPELSVVPTFGPGRAGLGVIGRF